VDTVPTPEAPAELIADKGYHCNRQPVAVLLSMI
jgi:hypothetical protein